MALFNKKKEDTKEEKKVTKKPVAKKAPAKKTTTKKVEKKDTKKKEVKSVGTKDVSWVLRKPRITEKSALSAEKKVYVFEVDPRATKKDIILAIGETYNVAPKKVNIAKVPSKKVTRRKRSGTTSGYKAGRKKAYIYLQEGDTIEFV